MKLEKVFFQATDGVKLFGILHLPENLKPKRVVVAVHGFSSSCVNHNRDEEIAKHLTEIGVAYFGFDNRGSGIITKRKHTENGKTQNFYGGSAYDKVIDAKCDVVGAIKAMQICGFDEIVLQGHSLGSSKVLMTYLDLLDEKNREILNLIKGVILLSPVDMKHISQQNDSMNTDKIKAQAELMISEGKANELIMKGILNSPISAETAKIIFDNIDKISIPTETDGGNFERLSKIKCPLMICYGESDMTISKTCDILEKAKQQIENKNLLCVIIKNTNHSYFEKEKELAKEIAGFVKKVY